MKEFDKQGWLEELADKFEVPVEQVMIAWAVYGETTQYTYVENVREHFNEVLGGVFKD